MACWQNEEVQSGFTLLLFWSYCKRQMKGFLLNHSAQQTVNEIETQ